MILGTQSRTFRKKPREGRERGSRGGAHVASKTTGEGTWQENLSMVVRDQQPVKPTEGISLLLVKSCAKERGIVVGAALTEIAKMVPPDIIY